MTSSKFLDYEVVLLLAKYGKEPVLNALTRRLGITQTDLEAVLKEIEEAKPVARRRAKPPPVNPIETVVAQNPQKAEQLRALHARFQSRTFLPELRDVRRFFEQHSRSLGHTKSRAACFPKLIQLLADLDLTELDALCQARRSEEYSSLGIISDEILRREQ